MLVPSPARENSIKNLAYYISGHGYGHYARSIPVLKQLVSGFNIHIKTEVPTFTKPNKNSKINIKKWTPNKIIIETDLENDNFVGLSEIYYPNWEIISHDIDIIQINGLLRGFVAPKGKNTIIMEFNYNDVKYASLISFISFFIMLLSLLSTCLLTIKNNYE